MGDLEFVAIPCAALVGVEFAGFPCTNLVIDLDGNKLPWVVLDGYLEGAEIPCEDFVGGLP